MGCVNTDSDILRELVPSLAMLAFYEQQARPKSGIH
jgi:hypothetical protein